MRSRAHRLPSQFEVVFLGRRSRARATDAHNGKSTYNMQFWFRFCKPPRNSDQIASIPSHGSPLWELLTSGWKAEIQPTAKYSPQYLLAFTHERTTVVLATQDNVTRDNWPGKNWPGTMCDVVVHVYM
eukprot:641926-Pyramimonas_sp.AAC.2